jgi:hypothetical protein
MFSDVEIRISDLLRQRRHLATIDGRHGLVAPRYGFAGGKKSLSERAPANGSKKSARESDDGCRCAPKTMKEQACSQTAADFANSSTLQTKTLELQRSISP